ncbi:tape measure protein [Agrobacterium tumefaciens]|uniref:tape measure protein n=1 Tax=Agrobacterium tumefaciens TaxID=358 RepID=UPI003BA2F5AD
MAQDLERLVVQLSADIKKYENAMAKAMGTTQKRANEIERRFLSMNAKVEKSFAGMGNRISSSLDVALRSTVALAGTALSVQEISQYADAWTEAGNKINAAATSAGVQARSLNDLKDGANEARTAFGDYVDLYARLIRSASGVAKSEQEIATATSIVSKAFKAGGASAQEQAAGILQLGQALGSGVLQGDELRSLRENAPILAQAIANEFKTTIAGLKQLGAEGKLTSDRVFSAILNAQKPIEAQFKATNSTIRDAVTRINNEFTAYIGNADASAGATGKLVEALNYLADNFKEVGDVVLQFITIITGALVGRALVGVVAGLGNAVAALGAFISAVRTGTLVAGGLAAALGPIGLIAGAAAAAIYLMVDSANATDTALTNANAAISSHAAALDEAKSSSQGYTTALRDQIKMQYEAAKASFDLAYAELNAARARAENFRTMTKALTGYELSFDPFDYAARTADDKATAIGKAALNLRAQLEQIDAELAKQPTGFGKGIGAAPAEKSKVPKKTADDRFREDIQAIKDRTAALIQEQSTVSLSYQEQEKRRLSLDLEQRALADLREEARKKGQTDLESVQLSAQQKKTIDEVSSAYAKQADALRQVEEAQQRAESSAQEFYDAARTGFADVITGAQSLSEALSGLLNKLADLVLNSAFDSLMGGSKATSSGGWLTKLFSGFAEGGYTGDGGKYQPAGVVHKGEYVFDKAAVQAAGGPAAMEAMRRNLKGYANGGAVGVSVPSVPILRSMSAQSAGVVVNFNPMIDNRGASVEAVARHEKALAKMQAELPYRVEEAVRSANKRNVKLR